MTSLVDDNDRGEAGQHDTYGFALDRRNRTSRRGDQISARAHTAHTRGGLPSARAPRCPCSGRTHFATKDNDPSFITDTSRSSRIVVGRVRSYELVDQRKVALVEAFLEQPA